MEEPVRQAYGAMAAQYVRLFGTTTEVHPDDLALITTHLSIGPGTVLDVGCGPGHLTEHLRSLGVDTSGIDLVPEFIDHAIATYPDGRYQLGSMHQLPFADGAFDAILAWYSLIHLLPNDLDAVLTELLRVIAPAGTFVTGFFDGDMVEAFNHKVVTAHYWPVDEFSARLQRAGFTETQRLLRPGDPTLGRRSHAAIVAIAS